MVEFMLLCNINELLNRFNFVQFTHDFKNKTLLWKDMFLETDCVLYLP